MQQHRIDVSGQHYAVRVYQLAKNVSSAINSE
jgi:hypothetical protein